MGWLLDGVRGKLFRPPCVQCAVLVKNVLLGEPSHALQGSGKNTHVCVCRQDMWQNAKFKLDTRTQMFVTIA